MVIIGKGRTCAACKYKVYKRKNKFKKVKKSKSLNPNKCIDCQEDDIMRFNLCYGCLVKLKY